MKKSQLRQIIREEIKNTLNEMFEMGDSVMLPNRLSGKITKIEGDEITVNTSRGSGTFHKNNLTLLKKSYRENESTDTHINPMVAKAYREYLKAKKDSAADVDFAEDPEKAYRYYSKKLNNTYSTRADRDAIEAILKKKYGSALEEQDVKRDITDVKPGDIIIHDETGKKYKVQRIINAVSYPGYNSGTKLAVVDSGGNERVVSPHIYSILDNGSLNEQDTQSKEKIKNEIERLEAIIWQIENTVQAWIPTSRIRKANMVNSIKKKIASLKKKSEMNEIKGFEEFKETGFKLGDKVVFMGSAHPTHTKPIKLTGTIEYFEPADEIGVRVDGYGKFIPFFGIQSNIQLLENLDTPQDKVYVVIPFYSDGVTIDENNVKVFTSYASADNYLNTLQGSPIIVDTSID